jgi:hypothetical protein
MTEEIRKGRSGKRQLKDRDDFQNRTFRLCEQRMNQ